MNGYIDEYGEFDLLDEDETTEDVDDDLDEPYEDDLAYEGDWHE